MMIRAAACGFRGGSNTKLPWTSREIPLDREHEAWRAILAFSYLFLVIGAYVILKAVRDSLYLDAFGAVKLPYVIIGIAILVGVFVDGYIRLSRHVRIDLLTTLTLLFLSANLVAFWAIGRTGQAWLYPVLYIWVGCYGVIAPVQVWTMVNEIFGTREAKRLVSIVGAGGIAGAVAGGAVTGVLAHKLGTIDLLLLVAGMLVVCVGVVRALARHRRVQPVLVRLPQPENLPAAVRTILRSRHLKVVAALIWLSAVCTTLVDWLFKASASGAGFDRDHLTSFFGTAYSVMALVCLGVQLLLVRGLLRRFGLGVVVLLLPLSLLVGSGVLLAFGSLWAATLLKSGDGAFKHSVDRSSKELAYLPVPAEIKMSVKSTIDMVLDRFGDGSGGVLLMVLATWLAFGVRTIALVNVPFLVGWLFVAMALRRSYLSELERSIGGRMRRSIAPEDELEDADARAALVGALRSDDEAAVLAALELVTDPQAEDLAPELHRLAREASPEVRAKVVGVLLQAGEEGLPEELTGGLQHDDQELLVRALDLVLAESPEELERRASDLIGRAAPHTRGAMLALMVRRLGPEFEPLARKMLDSLSAAASPVATRRAAAAAIGLLPPASSVAGQVERLIDDGDAGVRAEAALSAGRLRRVELAPRVIELLGSPRTRRSARKALNLWGHAAAPALASALLADKTPWEVRRRLPGLLAELATDGELVEVARALDSAGPAVRRAALESLSFRRHVFPGDPPYPEVIERAASGLGREVASCHRLLRSWKELQGHYGEPDVAFLAGQVRERALQSVERVFHWLEAGGASPAILRSIRDGLSSGNRTRRENATELLDGMLDRLLRPSVLALIELMPWTVDGKRQAAEPRAGDLDAALLRLAETTDGWLAAWAIQVAHHRGLGSVATRARETLEFIGPLLREELDRAAASTADAKETAMGRSTLLDKVMALKKLDLFQNVPAEELVPMARVAHEESFATSQTLFLEGDPTGAMYILLEGRVGLRRGEVAAGVMPAGSALGMWTLFEDQPRRVSAVALEPTRALVVDREDFFDVLGEHVSIVRSVLGDLVQRLHNVAV